MYRSCECESAIDTEPEWVTSSPRRRGEANSRLISSQVSIGVKAYIVAPLEATLSISHSELFTHSYSASDSAASSAFHTSDVGSIHSHSRSIVFICANITSEGYRAVAIMCGYSYRCPNGSDPFDNQSLSES